MRMAGRWLGLMLLAGGAVAADAPTTSGAPATDGCGGAETLFACPVKGGKEIRVCGAVGTPVWVGYTYGKPGAPELSFPKERPGSAMMFRHEARTAAQAMGDVLIFENNGVTYEVTEMIGGGGGPDAESNNFAGVYVTQGTKLLAKVACTAPPTSRWTRLTEILAEGSFSP
jgi:hypothetical protein